MKKAIRIFDAIVASLVLAVFCLIAFGNYALPENYTSYANSDFSLASLYKVKSNRREQSVDYSSSVAVNNEKSEIKLFGIIPVKEVNISEKSRQTVAVSGECFGIKLYTNGVIVVGTQAIEARDKKVNPAEECGLEIGDVIISINSQNVYSASEVEEILNDNNGKEYEIRYKRNGRYKTTTLTPVYSERQGEYKAGMWVRDSTAGIGTITFFNTQNSSFAALGHPVNDVDTNEIMPMLRGEAVKADVTKIEKASSGRTGSLCCTFTDEAIGTLSENRNNGVYGKYTANLVSPLMYEVASVQEVQKGFAQIITTIDDKGPQVFSIEIVKINYKDNGEQKNMVVKVTDKRLLSITGGIVQGMSGSPIIQNSRLVGALTHVIINNPTKGYAIFADNMLKESNSVK